MVAIADIYQFIQTELSVPESLLAEDSDIFQLFGIENDDAADFIQHFGDRFKIDLSSYLWYFHHGEAGLNIGGFFIKPPYKQVTRIPITPAILLKAATKKRWKLQYPDHQFPKKRWDMVINKAILCLVLFYLLNRFAPILIERIF
jgi:hypothetical protein